MKIKTTAEIACDFNINEEWNDELDLRRWVAVDELIKWCNELPLCRVRRKLKALLTQVVLSYFFQSILV